MIEAVAREARRAPLRRSRGRDPLGLRRTLADRLLPPLVAAMAFLAALALGGVAGAGAVAARWQAGIAAAVTVRLPPETDAVRLGAALAALRALPDVREARATDPARLAALLRPWLGNPAGSGVPALRLPVVIELRLADPPAAPDALAGRIAAAVPGAVAEAHAGWVARLATLARSLGALALTVLGLVAVVSAALVAMTVRSGIAGARDAIGILHDLGAGDADIAGRFAGRAAGRAGLGAAAGTLAATPVLAWLAALAAPLVGGGAESAGATAIAWDRLPWPELLLLPPLAAAIGWVAAQGTVRAWLRQLP